MILIDNAMVLRSAGVEEASVLIDGDTVLAVGKTPSGNGARRLDAGGAWLGPGLVDLHVHFRDPGETWKEDLWSGARAAASGGYTAVIAMPNTVPTVDDGGSAVEAIARAASVTDCRVLVAGALTRGRRGESMADLGSMHAGGIRFFSDDGDSVPEAGLMRRIMLTAASLPGAVVAQHAEDRSLSGDGHLHEGTMSALHGIAGIPSAAEDVIVARDLVLAAETGARVHIQHVSTATSVVMIEQAKAAGTPVTAEVTPHHLVLDDSALDDLDPMLKMYPPLRDAADRDSVVSALLRGVIDAVATDHAPHTFEEKAVPFEEAPRGVIGLETAASITSVALQGDQRMFFARLSVEPARIAGLSRHGIAVEPGAPANLVVFDPGRSWTVEGFESRSGNSPFLGEMLKGRVMATINEGRITYEGGL